VFTLDSSTAASTLNPVEEPIFSATTSYTDVRSSVLTVPAVSATASDPDSTVVTRSAAAFAISDALFGDGAANTVIPRERTISAASIPANFFFIGFSSFL
jgi:hypothetical protein